MQRQNRLRNRTQAELRFEEILNAIGIKYEKEKIIQNGDRFVLIDFISINPLDRKIQGFEIDGGCHNFQKKYDIGRDKWLEGIGIKITRFSNAEVLKKTQNVIEKLMEIMKCEKVC